MQTCCATQSSNDSPVSNPERKIQNIVTNSTVSAPLKKKSDRKHCTEMCTHAGRWMLLTVGRRRAAPGVSRVTRSQGCTEKGAAVSRAANQHSYDPDAGMRMLFRSSGALTKKIGLLILIILVKYCVSS